MSASDAQKSEVHGVTGDASTSPTAADDRKSTHGAAAKQTPESPKLHPDICETDVTIVRDDSDDGGPLVIEMNNPDLTPKRDER